MKTTLSRRFLTLAAIVALGFQASAQSLYWDSDGTGAGNDCGTGAGLGGSGTWDTVTALWALDSNCAGGDTTFTSGSAVNFSGTAGTVNITNPIAVGNMTFSTSGYILTNNAVYANTLTLNSDPTITIGAGNSALVVGQVAGTAGYNLTGGGTLWLTNSTKLDGNTITGPINVSGGSTLRIRSSFGIGGDTGDVTVNGGTLWQDDSGNGSLPPFIDNNFNFFPSSAASKNLVIGASGATIYLGNGSRSMLAWGGAGTHINGPGALTLTGLANMCLRMTIAGNTFSSLTINGPVQFQASAGGASDDTAFGAVPASTTANAVTITGGGVFQQNNNGVATLGINAKRGITVGANANDYGVIMTTGGTMNINSVITGPGNVMFSTNNVFNTIGTSSATYVRLKAAGTWTGKTILDGGHVVCDVANAIPNNVLQWNSDTTYGTRALDVLANVTVPSMFDFRTANANDLIEITNATFTVGSDNSAMQFGGTVNGNTGGIFTKVGSGTLNISNSWQVVAVNINGGTIRFGAAAAGLPDAGIITISGGTLDMNNIGDTMGALNGTDNIINGGRIVLAGTQTSGASWSGNYTGANGLNHSGTGTQTLSGNNTFINFTNANGRINFNSQGAPGTNNIYITGLCTNSTTAASVNITNAFITSGATTQMKVSAGAGDNLTLSGTISGSAMLVHDVKTDTGTVTILGVNTFTNVTSNLYNQISIGNAAALSTNTVVFGPASGGTGSLDNVAGVDLTIPNAIIANSGGFTYVGSANNLTITNTFTLTGTARTMNVNGNTCNITSLSQDVAGEGFAKGGAGTLVLTGTSSFTGNGNVTAGVLQVDGNISTSAGTTVSGTGTLKGNGTTAAVTVSSGGTIAPGASVGTLTTGSQTWNSGGAYQWEVTDAAGSPGLGGGYDTMTINGTLTNAASFATPFIIKVTGTPANFPGPGSWTIASATAISGFDARSFAVDTTGLTATLDPNKSFRVTQSGNNIVLTYADPAITTDPTNVVVQHGQTATFTASAVGASVSYQWQKGGVNISNGGNVSGATTSALTVANVADSDVASYDVVVTDSTIPASATSAGATLDIADAPVVNVNPTAHTVGVGTNAQFIVSWNGSADDIAKGITTFKWRTNGVSIADGAKYAGTATTNLTIINSSTNDAVTYSLFLTNQFGTATSSGAALGVDLVPTISQQPTSTTIAPYGGFESNSTKVVAAGGDLTYQWYQATATQTNLLVEDPINLVGVTTADLLITNAVDTNSGSYFVIVANYAGSVTSAVAVVDVPVDPVISVNPVSQSAVTTSNVVFTAVASGKPNLFYHWKKDGVNLVDDGIHIIGANTASVTLMNVTTADDASGPGYVLQVTNDFDLVSTNSTAATLTVFDPIVFTSGTFADGVLGGRAYTNGDQITLTAPISQGTTPTYQWKKGNANVQNNANITGSQSAALTILSGAITNGGTYSLVASNFAGAVTSTPPAVIVVDQAVLITTQPTSKTVDAAGHSTTFSVVATGNPLAYQWYFNSNVIAGATGSTYTIASVSSANIGNYHVVVNNLINSQTSVEVTLKIGQLFYYDALTNDTSANWNVYTNRLDGLATFAFDYSLRTNANTNGPGVPQNPNTTSSTALQLICDNLGGSTTPDSITLVPNNINITGDCEFSFDVFMNEVGNGLSTVTAESMTAAIGCVSAITNRASPGNANQGVCVTASNDEGDSSTYVMVTNSIPSGSGPVPDTDYYATGANIEKFNNPYYAYISGNSSIRIPSNETNSLLPGAANQTGGYSTGCFGLNWHHCVIKRSGSSTGHTNTTWYVDGTPIITVTNAFYSPSGNAISIGAWVNFSGGADTNWHFVLFNNVKVQSFDGAGVAPTLTTSVADTTVLQGAPAVLSVAASSPTALSYQWSKDGTPITDATNSTYTIDHAALTDAGTYNVMVVNASDFVSSTATLTVTPVAPLTAGMPSPAASTNAQGTNFILSVSVTGDFPAYQWYTVEGGIIAGATSSAPTLIAQPAGSTIAGQKTFTNHYYVIVTNTVSVTNSLTNKMVIVLDAKAPTLTLKSPLPKKVYSAATFAVNGTATDQSKGNIAAVRYYYVNSNTPNTTITFEANGAALTDKIVGNEAIKTFNITTNPPPLPGTNAIVAWAVDLAGNASTKLVTNVFFYAIPMPFTLHKLGDGTGSVSFKDKLGDKVSTVYFGTNASDATVNLNVGEVYTLTYTPDRRVNSIQNPGSVVSLVTNAPGMGLGTNSSRRWVGADILVESNLTSVTFEFDRDRFADMAGNYTGLFSVPNDPQIASSGLLQGFNVSTRGTYSAKIVNNGLTTTGIKGSFTADGTTSNLTGNFVITGYLDWAGSATAGGIKQFIGSVSNTVSGWNAPFVADRAEKNLLTAGAKRSLVLPGTNAPTGSSFAKILDTASSRAFTFTLADGAISASASGLAGTASSNFPIYVYAKYNATKDPNGKSVLFGTWNTSSNQVTLNWVKQANGAFNPAGFTNVELATIAGITNGLAGVHTVTISNASFNLSYQWDFTAGVRTGNLTTPTNTIAIKQDTTGKGVTVTFGNGNKKATTIGHAGVLEDAQTADGFFYQNFPLPLPTDSGSIHIQ